jgi:hypothetical protein
MGEPVLHGVPGFVLGADMSTAQLLVAPPAGATVRRPPRRHTRLSARAVLTEISLRNARTGHAIKDMPSSTTRACQVSSATSTTADGGTGKIQVGAARQLPSEGGFTSFPLTPSGRGRVSVTVTYSDGTSSVCHYMVLPAFSAQAQVSAQRLPSTDKAPRSTDKRAPLS